MAYIRVNQLQLQYPVIGGHDRSIRKKIIGIASGGRLHSEGNHIVVSALNGISFELNDGDRLGIIGPNGAGKSTLLKVLAGIYTPSSGYVQCQGHIVSILNMMLGLENEATGFENIKIRARMTGLSLEETCKFTQDVEEFCELEDFLHLPVQVYSTGMAVRLAFAMTTSQQADILLMDEMIGAGDAAFMKKATHRLNSFMDCARIITLASHSETIIKEFCNKALWLQEGRLLSFGPVEEVLEKYKQADCGPIS